jgi:hypothetical protein
LTGHSPSLECAGLQGTEEFLGGRSTLVMSHRPSPSRARFARTAWLMLKRKEAFDATKFLK